MKINWKELTKGIFKENPVFVIVLGLCPTLGVSTQVSNALGMSAGVLFVLLFSNLLISALRNFIPDSIHIPAYVVIIASLVTIIEMVMHAFVPAVYSALGVYLPLIVVNCIILGRAEAFASKNSIWLSIADALGMGLGFTLALVVVAGVREVLGNATFWGVPVPGLEPVLLMILPPGGFIVLGCLLGLMNHVQATLARRQGRTFTAPAHLDCRHCLLCSTDSKPAAAPSA